jgi:hypothetical protein
MPNHKLCASHSLQHRPRWDFLVGDNTDKGGTGNQIISGNNINSFEGNPPLSELSLTKIADKHICQNPLFYSE